MKKYTHLLHEERIKIAVLWQDGYSKTQIKNKLGRDYTTIKREIDRNKIIIDKRNNNNLEAKNKPENYYYFPDIAHKKYLERRKKSKQKCIFKTLALNQYVRKKLVDGLSPELIAGRAELKEIGKISHECIYQGIYSWDTRHLKLWEYLHRRRRKRRKRFGRKQKRTLIPNRVGIEMRPESVEDRKEFGHWETDSVLGVGKGSALNTNRERKTRKMIITKIPRKTAKNTRLAICKRFKHLPEFSRLTNTADNGCEFTQHEKITKTILMKFFFANPYSSWERGTNENGNGMIRRFFPKKTDFNKITNKQIQVVEDWINNRPMKCLGFKTPNEAFEEELARYHKKDEVFALDG